MKNRFNWVKALPWLAVISLGQCTSLILCTVNSHTSKPERVFIRDTIVVHDTIVPMKTLKNVGVNKKKGAAKVSSSSAFLESLPDGYSGTGEEFKKSTRKVKSKSGYIRGPRGGCYYINSKGKKVYVDRSLCD